MSKNKKYLKNRSDFKKAQRLLGFALLLGG